MNRINTVLTVLLTVDIVSTTNRVLWILGTVLVGVWMGGQANTALQVSDVINRVVHTFPIFAQNDLLSYFRFTFVKWSPTLTNKRNQKVSHNNNTSNTCFFSNNFILVEE